MKNQVIKVLTPEHGKKVIENLTKQLQKVIKEHPIDVENDTYWRGVMIGLKTAIEVARTVKK
jgi:hypothetical protein